MALIDIIALSVSHGTKAILRDINLGIHAGERVAILGGNGSGKTSLARAIAGWSMAAGQRGDVLYRGRSWSAWSIVERAAAVQLVGQIPAQHLSGRAFTVREEIAFGPENLGLDRKDIGERTDIALNAAKLHALAERNPFTLSGGEQQRLVIASCLALRPQVLVLDQPFTNLDPESRDAMLRVLQDLPRTLTLVLLETSPGLAAPLADRFLFLEAGMITAEGSAREVLLAPSVRSRLGLPALTEAVLALDGVAGAAECELPLVLEELQSFIQGLPCAEH